MDKQKIAKTLVITVLCLSTVMFLPWIYLTPIYYIMRYVIMAMTATAFVLTFSLTRVLSIRFVRLMLVTIACMLLFFILIPVQVSDISQLVTALLTLCIGAGLKWEERDWLNVSYYYTVLLIAVSICNSFYYAGGLYVLYRVHCQSLHRLAAHPPEPLSALLAVPERERHQRLLHALFRREHPHQHGPLQAARPGRRIL